MMVSTAPAVAVIGKNQKFVDCSGHVMDIEVRGTFPDLYFKLADVERCFGMSDLRSILLDDGNQFEREKHYDEFFVPVLINNKFRKNIRDIYLTCDGLVQILFIVHTAESENIQKWISKLVATYRFGSPKDHAQMAGELIHVPSESILNVFQTPTLTTTPCGYVISLGNINDLRNKLSFLEKYDKPNHNLVIYGCADDLGTILAECQWKFEGSNPEVITSSYVDPVYMEDAKQKMRDIMSQYHIPTDSHDNIGMLCEENNDIVKQRVSDSLKRYSGRLTSVLHHLEILSNNVEELKQSIVVLKHEASLREEIHTKELEIEKEKSKYKDVLVKQLETEIENWKIQGELYERQCLVYEQEHGSSTHEE